MLMTRRVVLYSVLLAALALPVAAQVDVTTLGPGIGTQVPDFSGVDQFGRRHTLQSSLGAKGAMVVFFRSADW